MKKQRTSIQVREKKVSNQREGEREVITICKKIRNIYENQNTDEKFSKEIDN